jgi:hypothetical protein
VSDKAEVTSEHREAAAVVWYHPYSWKYGQVLVWAATGERNAGVAVRLELAAQAIAEAEARGHCAGYDAGHRSRDADFAETKAAWEEASAEVTRLQGELAELKARLHQHEGRYDTDGLLRDEATRLKKGDANG